MCLFACTAIVLPLLLIRPVAHAAGQSSEKTGPATPDGPPAAWLKSAELEIIPVFTGGRFPNIVVTPQGTVLATWGNPQIRVRRSVDGGRNWEPEVIVAEKGIHGGGTTVNQHTGAIYVFAEDQHPPAPLQTYISHDDGRTWQTIAVSIAPDAEGRLPSMHMNEHGLTLRRGPHAGRLIRPSRYYGQGNRPESLWPTHFTNAVFSDDGGHTWQTSAPFPENGTGEACIAELCDGTLYYNTRRHWAPEGSDPRRRWAAFSKDGGATWGTAFICPELPDGPQNTNYGCMGGLVRLPILDRDILIYSNCDSPDGRRRGTVWASFDGGGTWPLKRLVTDGPFAYSSITAGIPGTASEGMIFLHFESGSGSSVARLNLRWILNGTVAKNGKIPEEFAKLMR